MAEHQGADIGFYVRDNGTTDPWQRLLCEDTLVFDLTTETTTTKSKCGTFKGFQIPEFKVSGTGVCEFAPNASQFSHDQIVDDMNAIQKKDFRIQDIATSGSLIMLGGSGYFQSAQITFNNGEVCKFTYNFEGVGTVEAHES